MSSKHSGNPSEGIVMNKSIPNIISFSRIILSLSMLLFEPLTLEFFIVICLCGITDFLDGYLARKYNLVSEFGSHLDSLGDFAFIVSLVVSFLLYYELKPWMIAWIIILAAIRLLAMIIGYVRYKKFTSVHSYINKAAGFIVYFLPFMVLLLGFDLTFILFCALYTISGIEYVIINAYSKEYRTDFTCILIEHP